ncbi:MAG: extracellular solute-binding protein [Candidatus Omnitrophica bacterium]|nr:extracellular solute-binding protein [Candidatus Omnitrophota bacterium]
MNLHESNLIRDHLVIISPHWEGIRIEITRKFSQWYQDKYHKEVTLEWLDQGGTSDDLRLVESLFKKTPEGIGIDVFWGGGLDPFLRLKEKKLLQRYVLKNELKRIPQTCLGVPNYDPEGYWYGVVLSSFGIVYNKKVLAYLRLPPPTTWQDLANFNYFSWVGAADPRHSGSMHMMYEIILQAYGWEQGWQVIFSLAGNTRNFSSSASQVARATALGDVAVALCIDTYALSQIQVNGEENMGFVLPERVTVINPDAIAILKGARHFTTACRFIDFLLSPEGQQIWMLPPGMPGGPVEFPLNRLSIRPESYLLPGIMFSQLNPYRQAPSFPYNPSLAASRWAFLNDLLGACVIDCHSELKKAWSLLQKTSSPQIRKQFYQLPIKPASQRFYWENWSDPVFRNQHLVRWLNFSREKFTMVSKQIQYFSR